MASMPRHCLKGHCPKGQASGAQPRLSVEKATHTSTFPVPPSGAIFPQAWLGCITMKASTIGLVVALAASWASPCCAGPEQRPGSILVLDQSELRGPFNYQMFSGLREVVTKEGRSHTTLYAESLD